ncbi:MAG TPA: hypothetical protein VIW94_10295 [Acidimicrobiia bacterium]
MTVALMMVPATAIAADLSELLEASHDASYSAEQLITCNTPDGIRDVLIDLEQRGGEIRYGNRSEDEPLIWSGDGGWSSPSGGSRIESSPTTPASGVATADSYVVDDGSETVYLGRPATRYVLTRGEVNRAELIVDDELGVFLSVVTYDADGATYCERRFVSLDPTPPDWQQVPAPDTETIDITAETLLPGQLGDFALVDVFSDDTGLSFAYYSDGFFSFAVFQSPIPIEAAGAAGFETGDGSYQREFTPGQVTYTWTVGEGGMALIGDLPPDMHAVILAELDSPRDPSFFNRWWRRIFG